MCVYNANDYQSNLLELHIRLVHAFIRRRIIRVVYWCSFKASTYIHYMKNYHSSLLTLVTCENILMDTEEHLKRKQDRFNGWRDTRID